MSGLTLETKMSYELTNIISDMLSINNGVVDMLSINQ